MRASPQMKGTSRPDRWEEVEQERARHREVGSIPSVTAPDPYPTFLGWLYFRASVVAYGVRCHLAFDLIVVGVVDTPAAVTVGTVVVVAGSAAAGATVVVVVGCDDAAVTVVLRVAVLAGGGEVAGAVVATATSSDFVTELLYLQPTRSIRQALGTVTSRWYVRPRDIHSVRRSARWPRSHGRG